MHWSSYLPAKQQPDYRNIYNLSSTPTMYLPDKDKKMTAKSLTIEQMVDLLKKEYQKMGMEIQS